MWPFRRKKQIAPTSLERKPIPPTPGSTYLDNRRYLHDMPYALPKDHDEGVRLNLQHYALFYALGAHYAAPLDALQTRFVLDVGCGTGIWCYEMARLFPRARVYGFDLEEQRTVSLSATVTLPPPNYTFTQGNLLQGLPFPDQRFDFTHMRLLTLAIPDQDWPAVLSELVRVTRSGGWVEVLEVGHTLIRPGKATQQIYALLLAFEATRGIGLEKFQHLGEMLAQVGLKQVSQRALDVPLSTWTQHGELLEKDFLAGFHALKPRLCETLLMDANAFERLLVQVPDECKEHHTAVRFYLAIGQR